MARNEQLRWLDAKDLMPKQEVYTAILAHRGNKDLAGGFSTIVMADLLSRGKEKHAYLGDVWLSLKLMRGRGIVEMNDSLYGQSWFFVTGKEKNDGDR